MRETPRPRDLRTRMQRMATKPTAPRRARAWPAPMVEPPRPLLPFDVNATEEEAPRSRLQTLLAWAQWELAVVPEQRLRWLRAVTRRHSVPDEPDNR